MPLFPHGGLSWTNGLPPLLTDVEQAKKALVMLMRVDTQPKLRQPSQKFMDGHPSHAMRRWA
jgi:hypothetical protein